MTSAKSTYALAPAPSEDIEQELSAFSPIIRQLLVNRNIRTSVEAEAFLTPRYDTLHDPFLMTDMERAVERILRAIAADEHIVIYSDYDCDGIPGGVLLHDFFSGIGYTHVRNYIPHRHHEGYGLNVSAIEKLHEEGAELIITVDCGITDVEPATRAKTLGVDLIITDHHEVGLTLPDAYAILNPKRDDAYPFAGLCGSGVAWKLVTALIARGNFPLKDGMEKWWLDVVGIATIADMVPLTGENRVLAHYGLSVLRKTRRPGLLQLLRSMRTDARNLTEDDIGFMIGPRINAASRMDTPEDAFHMLASREEGVAGTHARHLEKLNNERKGVVAAMVKDIKHRIAKMSDMRPVIVMGNPEWRPALVGLAANTLVESFKRPVFLWGRDGREVIKGSCRSDGSVSVVSLMHEVSDAFIEYGGHHVSGGFSVHPPEIHRFDTRLNEAYERIRTHAVAGADTTVVDAVLMLEDVSSSFVRDIGALAPFGEANPKPLFAFRDVAPERVESFGKEKAHIKATYRTSRGTLEAIAFFSDRGAYDALAEGKSATLIAHVEQSFFMNRPSTRLRIVDVLPDARMLV